MDLRHLRYFVAVAEELHFGRAAKRLNVAQPPLSRQIQDLEIWLQVRLFDRNRRKVELTSTGRVFLEHARRILADTERAVALARRAERGEIGEIEIGHSPSADLAILPALISELREKLPDVRLGLHHLSGFNLHDALLNRRIHAALLRLPLEREEFDIITLLREPLVAVLPQGHHLARHDRISVRELAEEQLILFPRSMSPRYFNVLAEFCAAEGGFGLHVAQESETIQTTMGLVAAGLGVSLQPQSVGNLNRTGVVLRPLRELMWVESGLAYRKSDKSELLARFLEIAIGCSRTLQASIDATSVPPR